MSCENCQTLREEYRKLDEFVQMLKRLIRDFNCRNGEYTEFERSIADRGFRSASNPFDDPSKGMRPPAAPRA